MTSDGSGWPAADLVAEGRRRYEAGDYADAEPLAQHALKLRSDTEPAVPPAARSEALQLAGEIAYSMARYAEARSLAEAALALRPDPASAEHAETETLHGVIDLAVDDVAAGLTHLERAFVTRESVLGPDHEDTIESLNDLAAALARSGRVDDAIAHNREALARCQRAFRGPSRQLAVTLNALAVKLGRSPETRDQATALYRQALDAAEVAVGPEHPMVATMLANLATQYLNRGESETARPLVARSIDLHERRYGADHPNTATALTNVVELAQRDGRFDVARATLERMLAIRFASFGVEDDRTRSTLQRLIRIMGDRLAADRSLQGDGIMLLGILRRVDATSRYPGLPPVALDPQAAGRDLGTYLERRRSLASVDQPARRALDRSRLALVAADASFASGDLDTSRVAIDGAIDAIEGVRGRDAIELVEPLHRRAAVERARDREDLALDDDERALAILARAYGDDHAFVLHARTRLAISRERELGPAAARPSFEALRDQLARVGAVGVLAGIAEQIDRHLARIATDARPETIGRSALRREALEHPSPLVAELLGAWEDVDWVALTHAYGSARGTPTELRLLLAADRRVVEDAANRLAGSLLHQGTLYPATSAAVTPMLRIAADPRVPHRRPAIELATSIVAQAAAEAGRGSAPDPVVATIRAQVPALRAVLRGLAADEDPAIRDVAEQASRYLDLATAATSR